MINKPFGYDETLVYGENKKLKAGAYLCTIYKAEMVQNVNGKNYLEINFDICDGEYKDYYKNKYANDTKEIKKWQGIWKIYQTTSQGGTNSFFKRFITAVENSNNFVFRWDEENNEESLKNKKVGIVMREEEFIGYDGIIRTTVKPYMAISQNSITTAKIPETKRLQCNANNNIQDITSVSIADYEGEDLPF